MEQKEITLYKSEVYDGVWRSYCDAVGAPYDAEAITLHYARATYNDDGKEVEICGKSN